MKCRDCEVFARVGDDCPFRPGTRADSDICDWRAIMLCAADRMSERGIASYESCDAGRLDS